MTAERLKVVEGGGEDAAGEPNQLTIEQLAQQTGMSVRNIRAHQARELLQPPQVRHRVGYYGAEHVDRLRLIQELQADGFNLKGIERLLEGAGPSDVLLDFKRAVTAPFESERPEIISLEELGEMFGDEATEESRQRAIKLGMLVPLGEDRFEVPSPALLRIAREVMERGVPLEAALAIVGDMQRRCEPVAKSFAELFMKWIWRPFEEQGHPAGRWPEVVESIERLRPIASEAMLAVFEHSMSEEADRAFGEEMNRMAKDSRPRKGRR